jgi:hypothetical protein
MPQHCYLDGFLILVMLVGIVGTLYHRIHGEYGIGDRAIQFVGICLVIPTVLILGLEDKISRENMGDDSRRDNRLRAFRDRRTSGKE